VRSIKFNHGSLYMVVQQLAKAGFIVEQETSRDGQRPERTVYALTDAGRHELGDWLRELVEVPQHEYPQFVAALSLIAALPPGEVLELLGRRLHRLTERRAEIRGLVDSTLAGGVHPLFLVEEDYRLALLDAESVFVERFIERINRPETGWGRLWAEHHGEPAGEPAITDERQES
jgi:DNA-binding PadR family transcriptional regulator